MGTGSPPQSGAALGVWGSDPRGTWGGGSCQRGGVAGDGGVQQDGGGPGASTVGIPGTACPHCRPCSERASSEPDTLGRWGLMPLDRCGDSGWAEAALSL